RRRISIKALTETIARLTGFNGEIVWDISKPNPATLQSRDRRPASPQACPELVEGLDVSRAKAWFGFRAQTPFEEGLRQAIEWYQSPVESVQVPVAEPPFEAKRQRHAKLSSS
ncbi:MAG: hypothetical protein AB1801_27900, partial [Chloroflexota bacterium]